LSGREKSLPYCPTLTGMDWKATARDGYFVGQR
jgi:hypothetical protein